MLYQQVSYYNPDLYGLAAIEKSITQLLKQADYLNDDEKQQLVNCCFFAANAHEGQKRRSGEPYICHPIKVAEILAKAVKFGVKILEAAVLHDVIEDTEVSKATVTEIFGDKVAELVDGVSKLDKSADVTPQMLQARTFEKLASAMEADPKVVMIKFADRMHNMQTLGALRPDKRRRIAQETLDVYVPIATQLGMYTFKTELEELAFQHLHPWRYQIVRKLLNDNEDRTETADEVQKTLTEQLRIENIPASVRKRRRNLLNIYKKIEKTRYRRRPLENASIPFIIFTDSIEDCYRVVGLIHQIYTPVFRKLTDYIGSPKVNGYQSLHTAVLTPNRRVINFQIRTKAMHTVAELGIIAIWRYHNQKHKVTSAYTGVSKDKAIRRWLGNVKNLSTLTANPVEYYEAVKRDLVGCDIQVFTPKGEPIALPTGASIIDFAYYIHTDLGNHLSSATVNGIEMDLDFKLSHGQSVELFPGKSFAPKTSWLKKAKTSRAKTAIRHFLRHLPAEDLEKMGKKALKNYLNKQHFAFKKLDKMLKTIAPQYQLTHKELLQKIALHEVKYRDILQSLRKLADKDGFSVRLKVKLLNKPGALAMLSETIGRHETNILRIDFPEDMNTHQVSIQLLLFTRADSHIAAILSELQTLDLVKHVKQESL